MDSVIMPENEADIAERREDRNYRLRWWMLLSLMFSIVVLALNTNMLNVALPSIQSELDASSTQLQWMVNIYMMVAGALMLTSGALSDRLGRARVLQAGLVVFCVGNLLAVLSASTTSVPLLIMARALVGVGAAMVLPCILSIITNVFPREERGKAIGIWAGLNASGLALGPIIGGAIVEHLDWEWIFIFNIIIAVVPLMLGWFLVPNSRDDRPNRLDLPGNVLFFAGIASLIYGLNNAGSNGWSDSIVLGAIIGSVVILTLFVLWELRTPEPVLNMSFFRSAGFSTGLTAMSIFLVGIAGLQYLLIFYLQLVKGYTPLQTGERLIPLAVGLLIGAIISVRLVARLNTKRVVSLGFLCAVVIFVFVSFFKSDSPYSQLGTELFFLGFFCGFITAPASTMLMGSLPVAKAGISSAMNNVVSYVGASIGVAALGSLLSSVYSSRFLSAAESIEGLSPALADKASDSVGAAIGIANSGQVPPNSIDALLDAAVNSFMDGWQIVAIVICAIFIVGIAVCLMFMPRRLDADRDTTTWEDD